MDRVMDRIVNGKAGGGQRTGLACPVCGVFIETSVWELLARRPLVCPGCGLVLTLDEGQSEQALKVLDKVRTAHGRNKF